MKKSIHTNEYRLLISLLREEREARNITQAELALRLSVNQAVVSKIETCERRIDLVEIRSVCMALGISLVDFVKKFESKL